MIEAPVKEPRDLDGASGVSVEVVSRSLARPLALAGMSMRAGHDEVVAVVGPSGCGKTTLLELICGLQQPDAGRVDAAPAALMPQRDLLLPWRSAIDNAGLALRARGVSRAAGPRRRRAVARAVRAGRIRARPAGRAVRRDAPAGFVPAHAARRQAGARAR